MPPLEGKDWEPHGFTIFCDDIREEVTGKSTYVGVYANVMLLNAQLPAVVPNLSLVIYLYQAPSSRFETLFIKVALPGEPMDAPSISTQILATEVPSNATLSNDYGDTLSHPRSLMTFKLNLTPFAVSRYGRVRVSALWDGRFVPLGSLLVQPPPA